MPASSKNNSSSIEYSKQLEEIRRINNERHHNSSIEWIRQANDQNSNYHNSLITTAGLLIPLSLIPLSSETLFSKLKPETINILFTSLCLLIFSIVFGMFSIVRQRKHLKKWAYYENSISKIWTDSIITFDPSNAYTRFKNMSEESRNLTKSKEPRLEIKPWSSYAQTLFLVSGIFAMIVSYAKLLQLRFVYSY